MPAGYLATTGLTILASQHNPPLEDIAAGLTARLMRSGVAPMTGPLWMYDGVAATPGLSFNSAKTTGVFKSTDGIGVSIGAAQAFEIAANRIGLPTGTTAARPGSPAAGMLRYNTDTGTPEVYGTAWIGLTPLPDTPQGRLTLTTATPVLVADASAQSTVYYTPYVGNLVPIYDGTKFNPTVFAELSIVMSGSNFAAGAIYDLFVASDSGTVRLAIGPAWSTATAGSGARGTGAGTTELQRLNGFWTNKVSATLRYASGSTFAAAANQATYVGTMFMDGTNSQVTCHVSYGQSRKWGLWNAYNRIPINLKAGDSTASWSETTTSYAEINGSIVNFLDVLTGLAEESVEYRYQQTVQPGTNVVHSGIGINSTSAISGSAHSVGGVSGIVAIGTGRHLAVPSIGVNRAACLFKTTGGSVTLSGSEVECVLSAQWRG